MTAADLEVSHSIELDITMNDKKATLLSTIEKIANPTTLLLAPLRKNGKLLGFTGDFTVNLIYGGKENTYMWSDIDVKPVKVDGEIYHAATLFGEPSIINRRGTFRVYSGEEMMLTTFTTDGPKHLRVLLRDISETGMAFFSRNALEVGRTIRLNLITQNERELHLSAQIVRQKSESSRFGTLYGCKFIEKHPLLPNYLMRLQQDRQRKRNGYF